MNVLYINHPESDYGGAFLYNGLCRVLGPGSVYDYPIKYSYHGQDYSYSTPVIERGFTSPLPWMPEYPVPWTEEQAGDGITLLEDVRGKLRAGFFQLVVLESLRAISMSTFAQLEDSIRHSGARIVAHEGEDFQHLCKEQLVRVLPDLHLKREVPMGMINWSHADLDVMPFPFSFPDTPATMAVHAEPSVDVIFMCGGTWDERLAVMGHLDRASHLSVLLGTDGGSRAKVENAQRVGDLSPWWDYARSVCGSRIGVSVRGFGHDTCRFWETAAYTLLAHDRPDLVIPYPYVDGVSCVEFSGGADLVAKATALLSPGRAEEHHRMRAACVRHTWEYHTNSARVLQMLERLNVQV